MLLDLTPTERDALLAAGLCQLQLLTLAPLCASRDRALRAALRSACEQLAAGTPFERSGIDAELERIRRDRAAAWEMEERG